MSGHEEREQQEEKHVDWEQNQNCTGGGLIPLFEKNGCFGVMQRITKLVSLTSIYEDSRNTVYTFPFVSVPTFTLDSS